MKLIETLTKQQKISILSGTATGIFPTMILDSDVYYSLINDLCFGYYMSRSGNKTVSPIYDRISDILLDSDLTKTRDELIGSFIRGKFNDKWTRVYKTLIQSEYDVLTNNDFDVTETIDSTDKTTYNITVSKSGENNETVTFNTTNAKTGTNTDNTTYDTEIEKNGKTGTNTTTTTENETENGIYGFNSVNSVGDTNESGTTTETVVGNADDNTSYEKETKTGEDKKTIDIDETETKTGEDSRDFTIDESEAKTGEDTFEKDSTKSLIKTARNMSGAELIEKELSVRNKQLFFDIVYSDIDSIATLQIYI